MPKVLTKGIRQDTGNAISLYVRPPSEKRTFCIVSTVETTRTVRDPLRVESQLLSRTDSVDPGDID